MTTKEQILTPKNPQTHPMRQQTTHPQSCSISNYTVLIEQDEDGLYVAKVPDIPGCYSQGKSVEKAIKRVKEAIQVCIEAEKLSYNF